MADRTTPRKEIGMTDPSKVKTLGIRLPDELHTQFVLVAQLDGLSLTDAIRRAVERYVETKRSEGDFAERAAAALEEIEREAASRRSVIQALFGSSGDTTPADKPTPTRSRKTGAES
jgi:hypothetical protein